MQNRYFIHLAFKGTDFHGWQVQPNAITVQGALNSALQTILKAKTNVVGCGRTDTGVHAHNFFAHFDYPGCINDVKQLVYKLNHILCDDIVIYKVQKALPDYHARFSAISRTYKYFIHQQKDPFLKQLSYAYSYKLNIDEMNKGALIIKRFTDFTSFSKLHTDVKTNNCSISHALWEKQGHRLIFTVSADRFLRNMVRAIVGTLLLLGRGKITPDDVARIIESKNRNNAGASVPAHGLYLWDISYNNLFGNKV